MKNSFLPFMLGIAWSLTGVYIFLNWDEITHSGWQIPKVGVVIFCLVSFGSLFSYMTLLVATHYDAPTPTRRDETKQTSTETNETETEELVELPPLRTIYKKHTL